MGDESDALVQKASDLARDTEDLKTRLATLKDGLAENLQEELVSIGKRTRGQRQLNVIIFFVVVGITLALIWIIVNRYIITPVTAIIGDLNDSSDQLATASDQIAAASQTLAEATSEQAASLEETSASLGEVSSMTRKNEENANQADILTNEAAEIVGGAKNSMEALSVSMDEISIASQDTSKIIKTIDEIAFQTNLLALNAAVEAARAGEAGAGFAVVADEVRNLAMRAAEAATNTTTLIEDTIAKVDIGTGLVTKTRDAVMKAEESSNKVSGLISEISAASKDQAQNIEQINAAVNEIDRATQHSAANAEESAAASSEMNAQTTKMRVRIDELQMLIYGGTSTTRESHPKNRGAKPASYLTHSQKPATRSLTAPSTVRKEIKPAEVIPMDDDGSFADF
jgi:methyl-accepting chemotaxis protein